MTFAERHYRTDWLYLAVNPIREMFRFAGRSTRAEVIAFFILGALANMSIITVISPGVLGMILIAMKLAWGFLFQFPWIGLFVRRLHDQDRSGWWAKLLLVPFAAVAFAVLPILHELKPESNGFGWRGVIVWGPWAITMATIYATAIIVQIILFLMPGTPGPNRYGPNPRLDPESGMSLA